MADESILIERGVVARLTLNRPERGNVMDDASLDLLTANLREIGADESCRVLVIGGAGEQFCRGRDPRGAQASGRRPTALDRRRSLARITAVNEALGTLPQVTIAAVNGDALGFGCGLAVQCDLTIAADHATFGFPEIDAGLPPTVVMSYLGRYVPRKWATELVLTGRRLTALQAERIGMLNEVAPAGELAGRVNALVETLLAKDPLALRTARQFLQESQDLSIAQATRYGLNLLSVVLSSREDGG